MIEKRRFGRTGHLSTVTIFGAAALKNVSQGEADCALDLLLGHGVNHIDTAPRYGDAELRIGPWMRAHRNDFFLATKTGQRTYAAARDEIRRSLDRLRVDSVDLLQLHSLAHPGEWEIAMGAGGALEAVVEAREEGLTRFIGVTGHGWTIASMHRRSLERFDFDSVLMPWNYVMSESERYREDFEAVCALCEERDVAVQTIKSVARGPWATTEPNRNTWYQPLEDPCRHRASRALGAGEATDLPQHGRRPGPAAGGAGGGKPVRSISGRRGDAYGHRGALRDTAIRDLDLTLARDHAGDIDDSLLGAHLPALVGKPEEPWRS